MLSFYKLEGQIQELMQRANIPGLAVAVVQDRQVVYAQGFGVTAAGDGGLPVTPQTLFRIGSTTKPMTGTIVMRLVEAGKLDLDTPVKEYIDWFSYSEAGAADAVTLRLLMSHAAGLPTAAEHFGRRDPGALALHVRGDIPGYELIAPPGKVFSYSNPGINVVGYVAEVVSGKTYGALMQEMLFDPLEMERTTLDPTVAMTYPIAQSHELTEDGTLRVQHRFADNVAHYPSGFIMSTVLDLSKFAIMHMSQGRFGDQQILSPESVAEMHTTQVDMYTPTNSGYGLTFFLNDYKGVRRVGHAGGISTFGSVFEMVPEAGAAVILLVNRMAPEFQAGGMALVDGVFDQLLELPAETPKPEPVSPDRSLWPAYVGTYLANYGGLATIQEADDNLVGDLNGKAVPLQAFRKDAYFAQGPEGQLLASVGFVPEEQGPVQFIVVNRSAFRRVELDPTFEPDPAGWAAYEGTYAFETVKVSVSLKEGRLIVDASRLGVSNEIPCVPLDNQRFACDLGLIEFNVAEDGTVPSLTWARREILTRV